MPDYQIVQGQTLPIFEDTLEYSNGNKVEPESVKFVMRSQTASEPLRLQGTSTVVNRSEGKVSFTPNAADTAVPGFYQACWEVKVSGETMTFPTVGYLSVEVQPSLSANRSPLLASVQDVKEHLFLPNNDRTKDDTFESMIEAAGLLIEQQTGPIVPRVYDEWYEGGSSSIYLRHRPSYGFGTTPIFELLAISEYRGPIEYNLSQVGTPTQGSVYSAMLHPELGTVVRRTAGGGTYAFWSDPSHPQQSVHIVYRVGQEVVPPNVKWALVETIRWWYETTQPTGQGAMTNADGEPRPKAGLPYHVREMLMPTKRHPSFA